MKVFLGGTVAGSKWRDYIMPRLKVDYYNPVVEEWSEDDRIREIREREECAYSLYVLTPKLEGYYAIAEVVDDSYKKTDKTIYCYLPEDDNDKFDEKQIATFEKLGREVVKNGALWLHSLDEIITYLNSAAQSREDTGIVDEFNDIFISYGRRHSLAFAWKIHNRLKSKGYDIWFDMNNIPLGVDFQEQIDAGIKKAKNFVFIISPHSVKSIYCLKEIAIALKYKKRIIPVLHIEPNDCWDKIHPEISRINWIYMRQKEDFDIPLEDWEFIDNFDVKFDDFIALLKRHNDYVTQHTLLLSKALTWEANLRDTQHLLVGEKRHDAQEWLLRPTKPNSFINEKGEVEPPPCLPTDLHAEYICQSRKNAENLLNDVFLSYDRDNLQQKEVIRCSLNRYAITSWTDTTDIDTGDNFENAIERGIEGADSIIFFISEKAFHSKYCIKELNYARELNKRIIPILVEKEEPESFKTGEHSWLNKFQYIQFNDFRGESLLYDLNDLKEAFEKKESIAKRDEKTPFQKSLDKLLIEIKSQKSYYRQHKILLIQALKWQQNHSDSMLLRGYNLENAKTWLKLSEQKQYKATELHKKYIETSSVKTGLISSEVFISYSRTDGDFARKLNMQLQIAGKTTWFDQESIASSVDFKLELYKGIAESYNFVFIISPDSINSSYCEDEVEYAKDNNKRIITILYREINPDEIPENLASIQWIDFKNNRFEDQFPELLRTLNADRKYVEEHTKWARLASSWIFKNRARDLLLRGQEINAAETWLRNAIEKNKTPEPTSYQREFIIRSRDIQIKEQQKKLRQKYISLSIGLAVALVFVFFSVILWQRAERSNSRAERLIEAIENILPTYNEKDANKKITFYEYSSSEAKKSFEIGKYGKSRLFYKLADVAPEKPKSKKFTEEIQKAETCLKIQKRAEDLYKKRKFKEAKEKYNEILKLNRKDKDAVEKINQCKLFADKLVLITDNSLYVSKYEITNQQFAVFLNEYGSDKVNPAKTSSPYGDRNMVFSNHWGVVFKNNRWEAQRDYENLPVTGVTWYGAEEFCKFYGGKLPTQSQWQLAAKGGDNRAKYRYAGSYSPDKVAWYAGSKEQRPQAVGTKEPNKLGLYDMSGNVAEWLDKDDRNDGTIAKVAGGSWNERNCSIFYIKERKPDEAYNNVGFRFFKDK